MDYWCVFGIGGDWGGARHVVDRG
eukprot:COSAG06_NODE_35778_length_455_cov_3.530899_2_plen_23_part_01